MTAMKLSALSRKSGATPSQAMGFCLFNNVAIAAAWLIATARAEKIAVLDYDVHHGNGTQDAFYQRPEVLYVSTHQYPLYPGTGAAGDVGDGRGEGHTLNIPLPAGSGDGTYARVFDEVVWPSAERFEPQLILVSAGFDAYWADPLAGMRLSLNGYSHLATEAIRMAQRLCEGRVVFMLEGGYNLDALRCGVANIARLLVGDPPDHSLPEPTRQRPEPDISDLVAMIEELHRL